MLIYPAVPVQVVVDDAEAFARVVAPVRSAHQELDHQPHVDQRDFIVGREVSLP